jgi:hypothetical protein
MLEKARIHRAMLSLDEKRAFAPSDIARETGAALTTIRKNFDRDLQAGWLRKHGVRAASIGRPETLFRFTALGRRLATHEIERAYSALATVDTRLEDEPSALVAGRELLTSLGDPDLDSATFAARLQMAQSAFEEAALTSKAPARAVAEQLGARVSSAVKLLASVGQAGSRTWDDARQQALTEIEKATTNPPNLLDLALAELRQLWPDDNLVRIQTLLGQLQKLVAHKLWRSRSSAIVQTSGQNSTLQLDFRLINVNPTIPVPQREINVIRLQQPDVWRSREPAPPPALARRASPTYAY